MKEFILNYYPEFKCTADKCKHSCCIGWEMEIDENTLNEYKADTSGFSTALNKGINFKKSTFKMNKNRRCAFLMDNGLCEIICNLGEEKLCQICSDHPRFRSATTNSLETGLGFCCEEATKIILSFKDKIQPIIGLELTLNQHNADPKMLRQESLSKVVLLAQNHTGYLNLCTLNRIMYMRTENHHLGPYITWDELTEHSEGLICLSGAHTGAIGMAILNNQNDTKKRLIRK